MGAGRLSDKCILQTGAWEVMNPRQTLGLGGVKQGFPGKAASGGYASATWAADNNVAALLPERVGDCRIWDDKNPVEASRHVSDGYGRLHIFPFFWS